MMYSDRLVSSCCIEEGRVVIFSTLQCKVALLIYAYTEKLREQTHTAMLHTVTQALKIIAHVLNKRLNALGKSSKKAGQI